MNRSPDPVLTRMPGSVIITVVLLGLQSLVAFSAGIVLASYLPQGVAVLLVMGGILNAAIAIGLALGMNWARVTGLVLSCVAVAAFVLGLLITAIEGTPVGNPAGFGTSILLYFLLSRKNTRAWCGAHESDVFGPVDEADEPFKRQDRVELIEGSDDIGLRARTVGTVIDLPADPGTVVVEFDDHPDREPIQVTLHVSEIRPVTAAE